MVYGGLETKDACETNGFENRIKAYEINAGLGAGSITFNCCSWSYCNYNASSLSLTDPSASLLRQLEGEMYSSKFSQTTNYRSFIQIH